MKKDDLTPKRKRFIEEYLIDRNGTQAAIRAGFSEKTAKVMAFRLLKIKAIAKAVKEKEEKLQEKTGITQEYVLNNLREIADFNKQKTVKSSAKKQTGSDDYEIEHREEMIDATAAIRANELLGKHLGLFVDKVKHLGDPENPIETKSTITVNAIDSRIADLIKK